jgi:hypothetical protein
MGERKAEADTRMGHIVDYAVDENALWAVEQALILGKEADLGIGGILGSPRRVLFSAPWPIGDPVHADSLRRTGPEARGNLYVERDWADCVINLNDFALDVITSMHIVVKEVPDWMRDTVEKACAVLGIEGLGGLAGPIETLCERVPTLADRFKLRSDGKTIWYPAMSPIVLFPCEHHYGTLELCVDARAGDEKFALNYVLGKTGMRFVGATNPLTGGYVVPMVDPYLRTPWLTSRGHRWMNVWDLSKVSPERQKKIKAKLQHLQPQLVD